MPSQQLSLEGNMLLTVVTIGSLLLITGTLLTGTTALPLAHATLA